MDINSAGDLVMCLDDFNGHVGGHIDGFDGVHGGYGVGRGIWKEECHYSFA